MYDSLTYCIVTKTILNHLRGVQIPSHKKKPFSSRNVKASPGTVTKSSQKKVRADPDDVFLLDNVLRREMKKEFELALKKETEV